MRMGGFFLEGMGSRALPPENLALFHEHARLLRRLEEALARLLWRFRALEAGEAGFQRGEAAATLRPDLDGNRGKVSGHGLY